MSAWTCNRRKSGRHCITLQSMILRHSSHPKSQK
ncbi:dna repair transcription protein, partial [Moniliophthora roreri]